MAVRTFSVSDPLTNKVYAKRLAVQAITETFAQRFMGTNAYSLCHVRNETQKGAGDRITIGLRMALNGAGVQGGNVLEGNEESFTTHDDAIIIDKLRHAVRVAGEGSISQQRVPFSLREEALDDLAQWWADRHDRWFANQLCGNTAGDGTSGDVSFGTDERYTGLQPTVAPDAGHILRFASTANDTALDALTSASTLMKLRHIDVAVENAKRANPLIRPIKIGGRSYYVMFIHTICATDLRLDAETAGNWFDIQGKLLQGGAIANSPIFDGSLGVYNGTILHEWERITPGAVGTTQAPGVRRNVFCGAQAAWAAFGQGFGSGRYEWVEKLFDYDNELGVSAGCIGGLKASRFNSADYGKIVVPTRADANTDLGDAS